jgi:hypothetical protein
MSEGAKRQCGLSWNAVAADDVLLERAMLGERDGSGERAICDRGQFSASYIGKLIVKHSYRRELEYRNAK